MNWRGWRGVFCTFCFLGQSRWEILKRNFRKSQAMIWPQVLLLKTSNGKGKPTGSVINIFGSSVQSFIYVWLFATPWTVARQASLSITNSWSLLKLMSIVLEDAIQPSHPLSSPSPAFSLSRYQVLFQGVSSLHQVAKVMELQLQHQSFQITREFSSVISFRIDWFGILANQATFKSLL